MVNVTCGEKQVESRYNVPEMTSVCSQMSLSKGKTVEDVKVVIPFPKTIATVNLTCTVGNFMFDDISKVWLAPSHSRDLLRMIQVLEWHIGKIPKDKTPLIQGNVAFPPDHEDIDENPVVTAEFKIQVTCI